MPSGGRGRRQRGERRKDAAGVVPLWGAADLPTEEGDARAFSHHRLKGCCSLPTAERSGAHTLHHLQGWVAAEDGVQLGDGGEGRGEVRVPEADDVLAIRARPQRILFPRKAQNPDCSISFSVLLQNFLFS